MAFAAAACPAAGGGRVQREDQMLMRSPCRIVLSDEEATVSTAHALSVRGAYRDRLRARIVLAAAAGKANAVIAREVGAHADTVRNWRRPARRLGGMILNTDELAAETT
jgi:hypothetical protein